jgi:NAD(P)-dependent dehydrogenase (short-subunit alcohol dehydrogenase family)
VPCAAAANSAVEASISTTGKSFTITGYPRLQADALRTGRTAFRPAQPEELAPAYVFLASNARSSYITGTVLLVMRGEAAGG